MSQNKEAVEKRRKEIAEEKLDKKIKCPKISEV